jgi:hypothetical protein
MGSLIPLFVYIPLGLYIPSRYHRNGEPKWLSGGIMTQYTYIIKYIKSILQKCYHSKTRQENKKYLPLSKIVTFKVGIDTNSRTGKLKCIQNRHNGMESMMCSFTKIDYFYPYPEHKN